MPRMGRRRTKDHDLPPGMVRKRDRYYYGRNQTALGDDYPTALKMWAELRGIPGERKTFAHACADYEKHELPKRQPGTRQNYGYHIATLLKVFGLVKLDEIYPGDVSEFLRKRPPHAGTHEKAVLSLIFNYARINRLTNAPNPCAGIKGTESRRRIYVTDEQLAAVYKVASRPMRDFLDLLYLTGQRPGDVIRMTRQDVRDGILYVKQAKTGTKVRLQASEAALTVLKRIEGQTFPVQELYLVLNEKGRGMKLSVMQERFRATLKKAGCGPFQMRDIRAKAITDSPDIRKAQKMAGHALETTTSVYRRDRVGELADSMARSVGDMKLRT